MMMMHFGMRGLGSADWSTMCVSTRPDPDDPSHFVDCLDANGNVIDSRSFTTGGTSTTPTDASSQPWWSTALTSLVTGTTQAIVGSGSKPLPSCAAVPVGTPCVPVAKPAAWYSTPIGMLGIALAVVGGGYLLLKK